MTLNKNYTPLTYYKIIENGKDLVEIDLLNSIFIVPAVLTAWQSTVQRLASNHHLAPRRLLLNPLPTPKRSIFKGIKNEKRNLAK